MNLELQRKIDRFVGIFLCRLLSLVPIKERLVKEAPEKILVILLSEMGSLVLAHPMFTAIRTKYVHADIHALVFSQNREILEILNVIPGKNIHTLENQSLSAFVKDMIRFLRRMQSIKFDAVIDCELFARVSSIVSRLSRASIRVGFHPHTQEGLYRGSFINRPVLYNPYHHISKQFMTLVEALDSKSWPPGKRKVLFEDYDIPQLQLASEDIEAFYERVFRDFSLPKSKKLVLLYPSGGILPIRAWPPEYYCRLAENLLKDGHAIAIIGMAEDKVLAQKIMVHCGSRDCADLTGYTKTLRELMALFHIASLLITNDGGPGQFAALTPIPTIIFYGPETPVLYAPLDRNAVLYHLPLSCSPCLTAYNHRNSPCDGENWCLRGIHPEEVYQKAREILEKKEGLQKR